MIHANLLPKFLYNIGTYYKIGMMIKIGIGNL